MARAAKRKSSPTLIGNPVFSKFFLYCGALTFFLGLYHLPSHINNVGPQLMVIGALLFLAGIVIHVFNYDDED
jgi:uncharacterized membrane protein YiaA